MTSTVPKIVIKPRQSSVRNATATSSAAQTPTSEMGSGGEDDDQDDDADADAEHEDDNAMDVDQDDNMTQTVHEGGEPENFAGMTVPRPRGRPRGRGRGTGTGSGTSTPRARGRGRGRGRGRPRGGVGSLMIRLPKRNDDDSDADGEPGNENDADNEGGEGMTLEPEEVEKEAPMGGGKPFRKIQGQVHIIDGDEFVTEDNPKGDEKIDKFGNLLGGRRFKASTFVIPNRHPERKYMLAIDAARTSGFRDSLYYFRRNLLALKLNATQPEKDYLISEGKLGSHLRTRSVTLITARSAYKLHGSKMILDGRWVTDDYDEERVLEEITARGLKAGDLVGELPDPNATHHSNELSALNATAAAGASNKPERGGGSGGGIYRAGGPTTIFGASGWGPYSDGPLNAVRKSLLSRDGVAEDNWMWMMATRVAEANENWTKQRKEAVRVIEGVDGLVMGGALLPPSYNHQKTYEEEEEDDGDGENEDEKSEAVEPIKPKSKKRKVGFEDRTPALGVYEPHANVIQYRADTQPTTARWESLVDSSAKRRVLGGTKVGNGAWALAYIDTVMEFPGAIAEQNSPETKERERLWKEVETSGEVPIELY